MFLGIEIAFGYKAGWRLIRDLFVKFVHHTRYWVTGDEDFVTHLNHAPHFAVKILQDVLEQHVWTNLYCVPDSAPAAESGPWNGKMAIGAITTHQPTRRIPMSLVSATGVAIGTVILSARLL